GGERDGAIAVVDETAALRLAGDRAAQTRELLGERIRDELDLHGREGSVWQPLRKAAHGAEEVLVEDATAKEEPPARARDHAAAWREEEGDTELRSRAQRHHRRTPAANAEVVEDDREPAADDPGGDPEKRGEDEHTLEAIAQEERGRRRDDEEGDHEHGPYRLERRDDDGRKKQDEDERDAAMGEADRLRELRVERCREDLLPE